MKLKPPRHLIGKLQQIILILVYRSSPLPQDKSAEKPLVGNGKPNIKF